MTDARSIPGKLVKGVFQRALFPDLSADLITALAGVGLNLSAPLAESYPREVWYRAIALTAEHLFPEKAEDARLTALGRHLIESLDARKLVKGPWLSMARLMGPKRALKQAAETGAQFSPIRLEVTERGAKAVQVSVEEDQQAPFLAGLLEGLVVVLGGKNPHVKVESVQSGHAVLAVRWS